MRRATLAEISEKLSKNELVAEIVEWLRLHRLLIENNEELVFSSTAYLLVAEIGRKLQKRRDELGLSQEAVASELRKWSDSQFLPASSMYLSRTENGKRLPTPADVIQLVVIMAEHECRKTQHPVSATVTQLLHSLFGPLDTERLRLCNQMLELCSLVYSVGMHIHNKYWLYRDEIEVTSKPGESITTVADEESFQQLSKGLADGSFGRVISIGEEKWKWPPKSLKVGDRVSVIDGIDSTFSFKHGIPLWTIPVAIGVWDGERLIPEISAVFNPPTGELYFAGRGLGAYMRTGNDLASAIPLRVSDVENLWEASVGTHLSATERSRTERFIASGLLAAIATHVPRTVMHVAGHLSLCWVASGRLAAFANPTTNAWDVFQSTLIIREAASADPRKGIIRDFDNPRREWTMSSKGVLACANSSIFAALSALILDRWSES